MEQSGGHVRVESEPGEGSTFSVYLPRATGHPDEAMAQPLLSDLRGTETLLLVEDSGSVRRLLRRYLERHGYTVIEATSGVDALRAMKRHEGPLDLLVADVVLPKMDGRALARQLERERPGLRVLYMSGFSDEALSDRDVFDHEVTLIQKPFTPPQLLRQIRTVLASPPPAGERDLSLRYNAPLVRLVGGAGAWRHSTGRWASSPEAARGSASRAPEPSSKAAAA